MASEPVTAEQQAVKDDAHLRSLGIKPELQRSLGFLSNFAVAFSYISVSTGTFTQPGRRLRRGRAGVLLGVADRHPGPDVRGPELRGALQPLPGRRLHLPVVQAPVQQDARLVHRLDLLLGRRRHGDGRGRHRAARALDHHRTIKLADPSPLPGLDNQSFWAS